MKIQTTGIYYDINYGQLNEEFGFIRFSWQDKKQFHNGYQLDHFAKEINLPILATVYLDGKKAFVMYQKKDKQNPYQLKNDINRYIQAHQDNGWDNIRADFVLAGREKENIAGRYLIQALLNSLGTKKEENKFNNINGGLLHYLPRKFVQGIWKNDQAIFRFQVKEDPVQGLFIDISACNMILKAEIVQKYQQEKKLAHHKQVEKLKKILQKPAYFLNIRTGMMERVFPQKEQALNNVYLITGRNGSHIATKALDTKSLDNLSYSRVGMLKKILDQVNQRYRGIVNIWWKKEQVESYEKKRATFADEKNLKKFVLPQIKERGLILINKTNPEYQAEGQCILEDIAQQIEKYLDIKPQILDQKKNGALHLVLIHEESFYQTKDEDPYLKDFQSIVQHITLENLQKTLKSKSDIGSIWKNCLKELIILADFYENRVSVMAWDSLPLSKQGTWYFGQVEKDHAYLVSIDQTGKMAFDHFQKETFFLEKQNHSAFSLCSELFLPQQKNLPIYFVLSPKREAYFFIRSEVRIIPNIEAIFAEIESIYEPIRPHLNTNKKVFFALQAECNHYHQFHLQVKERLEQLFNNDREAIKLGKESIWATIGKNIPRNSWEEKEIRKALRNLNLQGKPNRTGDYLQKNMPGMFSRTFWQIGKNSIAYTMGNRFNDYRDNFSRFQIVWYMKAKEDGQDNAIYQEMMPLMDNDFIVFRQTYTVLPFPFKYLREYIATENPQKVLEKEEIPFLGEQLNLF